MILKIIICAVFVTYATCRSAKDFREMPKAARSTQADFPSYNLIAPNGPGTYAFGYEIEDIATGNIQFRDEEKLQNGSIVGSFGFLTPDRTLHITRYVADHRGYRAKSETTKQDGNGPLKLEIQVQPSVLQKPYASQIQPQNQQNLQLITSSSTPFPEPFETIKPQLIDPALAASVYQQHQINLNPAYTPLRDPNVLDPQTLNALLHHQYFQPQNPEIYGFRQNSDGSVSTYTQQSSSQNRPPFFNWFGLNNNNNNNYQSDQQQQGPVIGFLTNLANNNPITSFFNSFQPQNDQQQSQNPLQNIFSNLNPFNLFSNNNNNRPSQSSPIQSDYVSMMAPSNQIPSSNIDASVFSNDHFLNPTQVPQTGFVNPNFNPNYNPGYTNPSFNPNFNPGLSVNFNPALANPSPVYNPNYSPGLPQAYLNQFSTTNRPGVNQQFQPHSLYHQSSNSYPVYQNPYQVISPISVTSNPNYNRKKTNIKNGKKKNKNKVDVPGTESDWFHDFLDKRKEASLDVSSRKPSKKSSDEDDDSDLDDYFR